MAIMPKMLYTHCIWVLVMQFIWNESYHCVHAEILHTWLFIALMFLHWVAKLVWLLNAILLPVCEWLHSSFYCKHFVQLIRYFFFFPLSFAIPQSISFRNSLAHSFLFPQALSYFAKFSFIHMVRPLLNSMHFNSFSFSISPLITPFLAMHFSCSSHSPHLICKHINLRRIFVVFFRIRSVLRVSVFEMSVSPFLCDDKRWILIRCYHQVPCAKISLELWCMCSIYASKMVCSKASSNALFYYAGICKCNS